MSILEGFHSKLLTGMLVNGCGLSLLNLSNTINMGAFCFIVPAVLVSYICLV